MGNAAHAAENVSCGEHALFWLLALVGGLVGLLSLIVLAGLLLPKEHTATATTALKASAAEVWRLLTDYPGQAAWRGLKSMERIGGSEEQPVWRETYRNGMALPLQTIESSPPRRLVRQVADPKLPFGGKWIYELQEQAEGCRLTITEMGEVRNPAFRVVSRFMDPSATLREFLQALGKKLGEEPVIRTECKR